MAPGRLTGADGAAPSWATWRAQAPAAPFGVLAGLLGELPADRWPDIKDWNALAEQRDVRNARGLPLRFVEAAPGKVAALDFERRILDAGEVQTRTENWHDTFHACTWLLFPRAKARVNALHMEAGAGLSPNKRSPLRDLLTLFDESGMVIACAEPALAGLLARFQWHALFWEQRARVRGAMDFLIFGHALFEHCQALRDGVTAKGMVVAVEPGYFSLPLEHRIEFLDAALAARFTDASRFTGPRDLQPLPVKGIPGWAAENSDPAYYLDERQFRPGRTRDRGNGLPAAAQPQPDK